MEYQVCKICENNKELTIENFYSVKRAKPNGSIFLYWYKNCRMCQSAHNKRYKKDNKENIDKNVKIYKENHIEEILEYQKEYGAKYRIENKNYIQEYKHNYDIENKDKNKFYRDNNKDKIQENLLQNKHKRNKRQRKYQKNRLASDPSFKMRTYMSSHIFAALKSNGGSKQDQSIMDYLPYTIEQLKAHLEAQFEPWMTWKNHGKYNRKIWIDLDPSTWTWHLDHIIPHSFFPYTDMDSDLFRDCWALSNIRPYSAKQNIIDGNRRPIIKQT